MTNKLVVIINSLKVPKIKKMLLYEMKFLVSNYSCLQNPWLGGYRPQIPILSVLCPQLNLLNPPPKKKSWVRHWLCPRYTGCWLSVAFCRTCRLTASSCVRLFCFVTLSTSMSHFIAGRTLPFRPSAVAQPAMPHSHVILRSVQHCSWCSHFSVIHFLLLICQRSGSLSPNISLCTSAPLSFTKNFCVLHIQSNTTIFHPVVQ